MVETKDLYWAAGFLEGEGCFSRTGKGRTPTVTAVQVDKEPLERLHAIFGGTLCFYQRKPGEKGRDYWIWRTSSALSVGVMLTLWSMLSERRQERIREIISEWSPRRFKTMREAGFCRKHGDEHVRRRKSSGRPYCLKCNASYGRAGSSLPQ